MRLAPLAAVVASIQMMITSVVQGRLIGAAVIPHGDFAYDPSLLRPSTTPERQAANQVARASRQAGSFISRLEPDVIFLSTPHGVQQLAEDFGVYLGSHASGSAKIGSDLPNSTITYEVNVSHLALALDLSYNLLSKLPNENISGVLPGNTLAWGEVIPLLLIPKGLRHRRHMIWSHPHRRYTQAPEMVPELVRVGALLRDWIEAMPNRIAIVISSDLSHTHLPDGPYGYSNTSQAFDSAVGHWAMDPCNNHECLLKKARSLQDDAKSCGFTGLVLLHGILCHGGRRKFEATLLANRNATYYGMMAATFEREKEQAAVS